MLKIFALIIAYFLGAIPVAYLVGKKTKGIDIRDYGSGNIGTTNAFRVLGATAGIFVFLGDLLKGYFAAALCLYLGGSEWGLAGAVVAILGHSFTIFLKFKGGKGVATSAGAFLALVPQVMLISIAIFAIIAYITRYVSLGSVISAISFPILLFIYDESNVTKVFGIIAACLVVYRHLPNIKRLLQGTESKIGRKN